MLARNGASPATAATECRARKTVTGKSDGQFSKPSNRHPQAIRAELIGSDLCIAAGYSTRGTTPILALCRTLVATGINPATPLECYRGRTLCLRIRSIGDAAELEINGWGTGFRKRPAAVVIAPPVAPLTAGAP